MSKTTILHIGYLEPHPDNIREDIGDVSETAASIMAHGILQPLVVVPRPDKPSYFWVIAGNRRLAAAKRARVQQIPVVIRRDVTTPEQVTEVMLVENCQRTDLNPMEKAEAMGRLRKAGKTSVEIARAIGMSDATVSMYLALLDLDASTRERVRARALSMADAVAAVRKTRARQRRQAGHKPNGTALTWEPDHFGSGHSLARNARALCDARDHNMRRRIGKVACGQCWETVIRQDEQVVQRAVNSATFLEPAVAT